MRSHWPIRKILLFVLPAYFFQTFGIPFSAPPSTAEEPDLLTLSSAVDKALVNNPLIRTTLSGREIADAQFREVRAGWFPLLQFNETFTRGNNPVFVFGSLLEQARFGPENFQIPSLNNPDPLNNFRTSIILRQTLFDRLHTFTLVNQARLGQQQAELQKITIEQQVRFEVIRSFYGVLIALSKKDVAEEAVKMAESDVKRARDRFRNGLTVQSDLLASEVQLAEFRQQLIDSEGDVVIAFASLNAVLGLPVDTVQKVAGELIDKSFQVARKEELLRSALLHRPDYIRAGYHVQAMKEAVRGAKREYLPRLEFMAAYGGSGKDLSSGSSDYTVSANLTLNLFDPARSARVSKARAAESLATAEQEHLANQIRLEVIRAYQHYVSARERLDVAGRAIDQASETHRIIRNRYREGLTTITEVLRAETALVRARLNLLAARYDHYVSYANVLLSSGRLTDIQPFL
jgi:outer membrane protein TolC